MHVRSRAAEREKRKLNKGKKNINNNFGCTSLKIMNEREIFINLSVKTVLSINNNKIIN